MKLLRLFIIGFLGYTFGYCLGTCTKGMAQTASYEVVHLNSLNTVSLRGKVASAREVNLTVNNTVVFDEEVTPNTVHNLFGALLFVRVNNDDLTQPIYLLIASPGGSYYEALRLKDIINSVPNLVVICKYCASAAGMLFGTFTGPRYVINKSELLMHEMYVNHVTSIIASNPRFSISLKKDSEDFNALLYKRIGISKAVYQKKIKGTEWSLIGPDIVKFNLADEVVKVNCDAFMQVVAPVTCKF